MAILAIKQSRGDIWIFKMTTKCIENAIFDQKLAKGLNLLIPHFYNFGGKKLISRTFLLSFFISINAILSMAPQLKKIVTNILKNFIH